MWGKRESLTANDKDLISVSLKIIRAPSSGRGRRAKRSEAGLASLNVGVPFHATNLHPFFLPPSKGRREKKGAACIVIGIVAAKPTPSLLYPLPLNPPLPFLFQRKAERCAVHVGKA